MSTALKAFNLVVIGAGTAGLVAAAGAAGLGARVALVERNQMGGDCLNFGCVPSKALISSARLAQRIREASLWGLENLDPGFSFEKVFQRMRALRAGLAPNDSQERFESVGVKVFRGPGLGERNHPPGAPFCHRHREPRRHSRSSGPR
jgi:pyruvate/2-oxoglutarate dehydrogenase complex dihydrolipoamide dehydrogenase (E3) component